MLHAFRKEVIALKKLSDLFLVFVLCLIFLSTYISAAPATKVEVILPTFGITINSCSVDNSIRSYPFILYKDITYAPTNTYDWDHYGLELAFDSNTELYSLEQILYIGLYDKPESSEPNVSSYLAEVRSYPLTINGSHQNSTLDYPLLFFRGVIYIPLTWDICVDMLGWDLAFDSAEGFTIHTSNPRARVYPISSDFRVLYPPEGLRPRSN